MLTIVFGNGGDRFEFQCVMPKSFLKPRYDVRKHMKTSSNLPASRLLQVFYNDKRCLRGAFKHTSMCTMANINAYIIRASPLCKHISVCGLEV